ncbi:PPA1309 family protein [Corynebacterium tapiri]|uniref:Uncharacterized protein n=1 Tax=Corynebacterium tapiri TaxID=1448266 RepID=A0A5C4U522_9CORY|nr:PPA1309 family protein [Corynebacterium tapiri]TNL98390.1 hypothetical protein FHE74_04105 [Corynebacterium tapiri]
MLYDEPTQQALNSAMREAVDFIHAEGWDNPPTLFALVPTDLLGDHIDLTDESASPLSLVVQDSLPENLPAGSEELVDYCARAAWPEQVAGVILAQEIMFRDQSEGPNAPAREARLYSGVLRDSDIHLTILQLRPTEAELAERGPFAEDEPELRGGPSVAPGVIEALRAGLERDPDELA